MGPMTRTRSERIRCTLLGLEDGPILCPVNLRLALEFGRMDPVATAYRLLAKAKLRNPESLRIAFGEALSPMVCRPNPGLQSINAATADPMEVLRMAFLLGLCSSVRFDPERPVLWTRASLTRRLELFETKEFYT